MAQAQMQPASEQITQLLQSWNQGDQGAIEKLVPLVYDELHRLAQRYMSDERPGHTLQTTALVNEAYLRLVHSAHANWESRTHFFGVCAQVMRRILVDWARSRQALKRGGERDGSWQSGTACSAESPAPIRSQAWCRQRRL
jgi:RNA polymerase sigma-70 factor (ECF subfamily)